MGANPNLDFNELVHYSNSHYAFFDVVKSLLVRGRFEFFDVIVKRGFRFDLNFLRFPTSILLNDKLFLLIAISTNDTKIVDYVIKYYSPNTFSRQHLTFIINDISVYCLNSILKKWPNLLTDRPQVEISNKYEEDPIASAKNATILKRLLELQIPRREDSGYFYAISFARNFTNTLDLRFLDLPLAHGFNFSQAHLNISSFSAEAWNKVSDKKDFLIQLRLRALSNNQPRGVQMMMAYEQMVISHTIGSTFSWNDHGRPSVEHVNTELDILKNYIAAFGIDKNANLLKEFLTPHGPTPNFFWDIPEYENAFITMLNLDPNPDLQYALDVVQNLREAKPENRIYRNLVSAIQNRMPKQ